MKPLIHRTNIVTIHGNKGRAVSLDEYIETESPSINAGKLRQLAGMTRQMREKLITEQARQHHDLHEGTDALVLLLESSQVASCSDPLPKHLAEAGVAAAYLLKGVDLIPDWVPEIGLTDDARLVARVLERNPELARKAAA